MAPGGGREKEEKKRLRGAVWTIAASGKTPG